MKRPAIASALYAAFMSWIRRAPVRKPVAEVPRDQCEHSTGCYLCPRDRCIGQLNDPDDPDLSKPRTSNSGHCLYLPTENGGHLRIRVSKEDANAYYAKKAEEERKRTPPESWKGPGWDEAEVRKLFDKPGGQAGS